VMMLQRILPRRDPVPSCLFPIRQKIPKFGDLDSPQASQIKQLVNGIALAIHKQSQRNVEAMTNSIRP
jgi:hypothetical protein